MKIEFVALAEDGTSVLVRADDGDMTMHRNDALVLRNMLCYWLGLPSEADLHPPFGRMGVLGVAFEGSETP